MNVADIGEFGLIELVAKTIGDFQPSDISEHIFLPPRAMIRPPEVLINIGDDTSAWEPDAPVQLATTDTMVQDVHFSLSYTTWRELGWKSLAANVSDIAAMGGYPRYALVTLGLPGNLEVEHVVHLYQGMLDVATRFGVAIVGGDMVKAKEVFITVALTGDAPPLPTARSNYMLRSAAKPGDKIAVTGFLGSSAAGLKMLSQSLVLETTAATYLRESHLRPAPRVLEGVLARRLGVLAAMDISDGLIGDLSKVCQASGVGATVDLERVPIHPLVASAFPDEAVSMALSGGEDYELLIIAPELIVERVEENAAIPVSIIGEITADHAGRVRVLDAGGQEIQLRRAGWDHFVEG